MTNTSLNKVLKNAVKEVFQLDIFDVIGDTWSATTTADIAAQLANASSTDTIQVRIDSPGGSVQDGFAIAAMLRQASQRVEVNIIGFAASIASIIAQAGDRVTMAKGSMYMIHQPWMLTAGGSEELRKEADILDKIEASLVDIYVEAIDKRNKLVNGSIEETRAQVAEWVAAETWFTAAEALQHGFIDAVEGETREAPTGAAATDIQNFTNKYFNHAPNRVKIPNNMADTTPNKSIFARFFAWIKNDADAAAELEQLMSEETTEVVEAVIETTPATPTAPTAEEIAAATAILEAAKVIEDARLAALEALEATKAPAESEEAMQARIRAELNAENKSIIEAAVKQRIAEAKAAAPAGAGSEAKASDKPAIKAHSGWEDAAKRMKENYGFI